MKLSRVSGLACLLAGCVSAVSSAAAAPVLDGVWRDNGVVQRGAPVAFSGKADPGSTVAVQLGPNVAETIAAEDGEWSVSLAALEAGGPFDLSVSDGSGELHHQNIMVGDVLLCSGQSNMEYPVYRALNPDSVMAEAGDARLRLLSVPKSAVVTPERSLPDEAGWLAATPETVRDFSAVCYFAGRALRARNDVAVGLIDASWGGSQIEAWLPFSQLEDAGNFASELEQLRLYERDTSAAMAAFGGHWEAWWMDAHNGTRPWASTSDGPDWSDAPDQMMDWKAYGDPALETHLGQVWFSRSFELTPEQARQAGRLSLGLFDDTDATWLNGKFLGSTSSWSDPRTYDVAEGHLQPGRNTIIVNVLNTYGQGGMLGPAGGVMLRLAGGDTIALGADWRYRKVDPAAGNGPSPAWEAVTGYTTIHNGMIAPLGHPALYAALWYQGESNAGRSHQYQGLLGKLTASWRARFGTDLPVVIVQLPVYGAMSDMPGPSGWAGIREAQRKVAVAEKDTGLAVVLDAGERLDIHPPNKLLVAQRILAVLEALKGGRTGAEDGIVPVRVTETGATVSLTLPAGDYRTIGSDRPIAFELCGAPDQCAWAKADLDGNVIELEKPAETEASLVRYCWGDAPVCNLFTADDTPVSPFEMAIE